MLLPWRISLPAPSHLADTLLRAPRNTRYWAYLSQGDTHQTVFCRFVPLFADIASRVVPSPDICCKTIGFPRSPSAGLVIMQRDCIIQNRIDNRPRSLYYILANEK